MRKSILLFIVLSVGALALGASSPASYTVQPGDTLGTIAARFHTTVQRLASLNHIRDVNVISVGEVLRLSSSSKGIGQVGLAGRHSIVGFASRVAGPTIRYWKPLFPLPGIAVVAPWLLLIVWSMSAARRRRDVEGDLMPGRAPGWLPWLAALPLALAVAAPYVPGLPRVPEGPVATGTALGVQAPRSEAAASQVSVGGEQPPAVGSSGTGVRTQKQWEALFNAGKVMVGCGGQSMTDWDPNKQANYAFHQCGQPEWSRKVVSEINRVNASGSSEGAGVTPLLALATPQGTLTLLDYYNSMLLANSGHTITLFYLQGSNGYDGLVGALDNWGPVKLQKLGDSFRLTTQGPVYMGADPMCCPSIILNATFDGTSTGLSLVDRQTRFEDNGTAAQQLKVALKKRGYEAQQVNQVMNDVASIALSPGLSNQQKKSQYQQLAEKWGQGVLSVAVGLMPIYNPNKNQWQSFGSWANEQASQLPGDSQFKQDPVGTTVRMLFDPSPSNISQALGLGSW